MQSVEPFERHVEWLAASVSVHQVVFEHTKPERDCGVDHTSLVQPLRFGCRQVPEEITNQVLF